MKTKIIATLFIILSVSALCGAQDFKEVPKDTVKQGFAVHSVNFTAGFYAPEMDYWNDYYLLSRGIEGSFEGNMTYGANITFLLSENFRSRVGGSFWSEKLCGSPASDINGLKIQFTRFNLGLFYAPANVNFIGFQPYLGAEVQAILVKNEYNIDGSCINRSGEDILFNPVLGIDRNFGHFNCGAEVKYNLGNYVQEEMDNVILEHDVAVNGPEVSISLGYRF